MHLPSEIRGTAGDFVDALTRKDMWGDSLLDEINASSELPLTAEEVGQAILYAIDELVRYIIEYPDEYVWGAHPVVSNTYVNQAMEFIRSQKAKATNTIEE